MANFIAIFFCGFMKKLLIIGFTLIICTILSAQFRVGGEIGANGSSLGSDDKTAYQTNSFLYGGEIGATGEYSITNDLIFKGGLFFSQKGMNTSAINIEANGETTYIKSKIRFDYLVIPIMYHDVTQLSRAERFKAFFNVGPVISVAVYGFRNDSYNRISSGLNVSADSSKTFHVGYTGKDITPINLGLHLGGGLEYNDAFTVEFFYYKGLTKAQGETHSYNSSFGITFGYIYTIPGKYR